MDEKKQIERSTADAFIKFHNSEYATSYRIVEHSDNPDIRCQDGERNSLSLEIMMTEDRPGDIQAVLGRSDARSLEALKAHNKAGNAGEASAFEWASCLKDDVLSMVVIRVQRKLKNDYGPNVALVIWDVSGGDWNWDMVANKFRRLLDLTRNPFDRGIWIMSLRRDRIFRMV